jgi:hypothetical protein
MKHFESVEQAYSKIKASTGISDTKTIIDKFMAIEQTYSNLLSTVARHEKNIAELKKKGELLED